MPSITRRATSMSLLGFLILCAACREADGPSPDPGNSSSRAFQFALLGDNPYPAESVPKFEALIDEINRDPDLEWAIHVGDILLGGSKCSDAEFKSRFDLFQRFQIPFVFTPGDNNIVIKGDGQVTANGEQRGTLRVVTFENERRLGKVAGNLFRSDETPNEKSEAEIVQGVIEQSNVQPILEIARMIKAMRSYQGAQSLIEKEHDRQRQAIEKLTREQ